MLAEHLLTPFLRNTLRHSMQIGENIPNLQFPAAKKDGKYLLYMHIPFCERLCPYCSFNRFIFKEDKAKRYYEQLRKEMRLTAELGYNFSSVYIGGGTPTVLVDELAQTIDLARELFDIQEVSCETNPNHLTEEILGKLQGRVQRLSVGMQSFDDGLLKQMNRYDKYGSGAENIARIQKVNGMFPTLNVDMIFNFPSQTLEILEEDIKSIIKSGANQTTFYALMTSPIVARSMANSVGKVDYKREVEYYRLITEKLGEVYTPISAWSFSRKGNDLIDEYIVDHEEYVGIGSGSFSYLDGSLYVNTFSLKEYEKRLTENRFSVCKKRDFSKHEQMRYRFMMDLFGLKLDKKAFKESFGTSIERGLWLEMAYMNFWGAFKEKKNHLELTPTGQYLMVVMMREFFSSMDRVRELSRQELEPQEAAELLGDLCGTLHSAANIRQK